MSDIAVDPAEVSVKPVAETRLYRAATFADIDLVHATLREAIESMPYYNDQFKAYEIARLSKDHLAALIELDPHHVMIFLHEDKLAGFMISGPELGALWLYWSYLLPERRRSRLGLYGMRDFVRHWDNGRFHKISTYTMAGNEPAKAVMLRQGFSETATLKQHMFGEDYMLYEHVLNKVEPGYGLGIKMGLRHRLRRTIKRLLARK